MGDLSNAYSKLVLCKPGHGVLVAVDELLLYEHYAFIYRVDVEETMVPESQQKPVELLSLSAGESEPSVEVDESM
jgi:hypothetical protein